jgi:hypothetical protein
MPEPDDLDTFTRMESSSYEFDGNLLQIGDGVLEQFSRTVLGSKRIPIRWVAVQLEPAKHDAVRVQVGMASNPEAPFYSSPPIVEKAFNFTIPATEEPRLRAFLDAAARSHGRAT